MTLTARLAEWRQALTDGKEDALAAAIDDGLVAGEKWMEANILGRWEEERESPPMPTSSGMFRDLFGFGKWRIPPPGQKRKIGSPVPFVYIVRCADGTLYTGWTTDVERRVAQHNAGRGARYTRMRRPVALVYREEAPDRSTAMRREVAIKKLDRERKERLVELQR